MNLRAIGAKLVGRACVYCTTVFAWCNKSGHENRAQRKGHTMVENNDTWAVVELMGHVTLAGRVTKPGEYGGLWQIDIPDGESFRSEFFGSQSVYRIRIVSEEIARGFGQPAPKIIAYAAAIISRDEHEHAMRMVRAEMQDEIIELRRRLTLFFSPPSDEYEEDDEDAENRYQRRSIGLA